MMDRALHNGVNMQEPTVKVFGLHMISTFSRGVSSHCRTT